MYGVRMNCTVAKMASHTRFSSERPARDSARTIPWIAVAAQTLAVTTGRYAPYPPPAARPARGAVGTAIAALRSSWGRT